MKFLDADGKRPVSSVSATVDEGNTVVFVPQESYIDAGIPMSRRRGVFVVQLDAQAGSRTTKTVRFDKPNAARPKTENEAGKEECVTRIEEVDDVEHEKSEEQRKQEEEEELGERKTTRKHDPRQPCEQQRIAHEMTHLPFRRGGR